tara:strand:- start:2381 stop:3148 length:768 start_codon:yes stop_codon:yes gene_type:complete
MSCNSRPVWICGNSHTLALRNAWIKHPSNKKIDRVFALGSGKWMWEPFHRVGESGVQFIPDEFVANLEKATGQNYLSQNYTWGFTIGGHTTRIYRNSIWQTSMLSKQATDHERPISEGLFAALAHADNAPVLNFFKDLKECGYDFFVVGAPPPHESNMTISPNYPRSKLAMIEGAARKLFMHGLEELNVPYIKIPASTLADDGLLLNRYKLEKRFDGKPDAHHANEEFGTLLLDEILKFIRTGSAETNYDVEQTN